MEENDTFIGGSCSQNKYVGLTSAERVRGEVVEGDGVARVVVRGDAQLVVRGGREPAHAEHALRRLHAVRH